MEVKACDLRHNLYAMCLAILDDEVATPEQAFRKMKGKPITTVYNEDDIRDMESLVRQGLTHREVGEVYGISKGSVWHRINNYKKSLLATTRKAK